MIGNNGNGNNSSGCFGENSGKCMWRWKLIACFKLIL
jgi:hypothetical protein